MTEPPAGATPVPVSYGPRTFSDVDASGQAADHAAYLDRVAVLFADLRRSWLSHLELRPGEVVLDAGCGVGEVARLIAAAAAPNGRVVGVDLSADLVERAHRRATGSLDVQYRVGDVTALPFEAATFDAVYCERVFQHLAEPQSAMAELHRVLRPGGRLAVVDPDFTRSAQDADDPQVADVLTAAAPRLVANPSSGRRLRSLMVNAGFTEIAVHPTLLVTTDAERHRTLSPRSLDERLLDLVTTGDLDRTQADAFVDDQNRREADGRFLVATPIYCVTGTRPSRAAGCPSRQTSDRP